MGVEITRAAPDRLSALASVLGRAFVTEPMVRWPLGDHGDLEERFTRAFEYFIEDLIPLGMVWEAGAAVGALVWITPDQAGAWEQAMLSNRRMAALTEDRGRRFDSFWEWSTRSSRTIQPV